METKRITEAERNGIRITRDVVGLKSKTQVSGVY
jgi:hypothetical protein